MKYCTKCGAQINDEDSFCNICGARQENSESDAAVTAAPAYSTAPVANKESGLATAAKIFMILGCIINGVVGLLVPLCWCIPMTVIYCRKVKNNEPVGMGFKICSLLFVSLLGGIFMLCDNN